MKINLETQINQIIEATNTKTNEKIFYIEKNGEWQKIIF